MKPRILIIDDEVAIRDSLRMVLEYEGYEVSSAATGEEGIATLEREAPDLVFLDIKMPGMDGLEAAEQIAARRIAPVVILTAFSQRDLVERARDIGAMAYLVKPFQKHDLVPAIEMAVSRYTETAALEAEVSNLTERLESRKAIDRAKGQLMAQRSWTEPQAFRWIQRTAMDRRQSMRFIAEAVLAGESDDS